MMKRALSGAAPALAVFFCVIIFAGQAFAQAFPEYGVITKSKPSGKIKFPDPFAPQAQAAPARPKQPQPAPSTGDIAFVRDGDIYTIGVDGTNQRRLTTDGKNAFPIWSPTGRYITFAKANPPENNRTTASLWVMTSEGKFARRLVKGTGACYPLAWLPRDEGIIYNFIELYTESVPALDLVYLDKKTNPRPLTRMWEKCAKKLYGQKWGFFGQAFAFAPNRSQMLLTGHTMDAEEHPQMGLFRMNFNASGLVKLSPPAPAKIICMRWHPLAMEVLAQEEATGSPGGQARIVVMTPGGKVLKKLAATNVASFSGMDWSSRGNYIIYQMTGKEYPGLELPSEFPTLSSHSSVWAMKADGSEKYKLADNACHPNWK